MDIIGKPAVPFFHSANDAGDQELPYRLSFSTLTYSQVSLLQFQPEAGVGYTRDSFL